MTTRPWGRCLFSTLLALILVTPCPAFDILLDAGHSPRTPGAISCSKLPEYEFNRFLVGQVIAVFSSASGINISGTWEKSSEPTLMERANQAKGKDLILSFHHDSVQPRFLVAGCTDHAQGFSLFVSRKNPRYRESLAYAKAIARELLAAGFAPSTHHAEDVPGERRVPLDFELGIYAGDDLVVLKRAAAPAVLVEAAVITNPADEQRAADATQAAAFARAVGVGVVRAKQKTP